MSAKRAVLRAVGAIAAATIFVCSTESSACTPVRAERDAQYVGGDLFQQIARRAFQIDLFRVSGERPTEEHGRAAWSRNRRISEYTLTFVRHEAAALGFRLAPMPRDLVIRGYHAEANDFDERHFPNARQWLVPRQIEQPGFGGYLTPLSPVPPEQESSCQSVFVMAPGALVLVLRDADARLYDTDFVNRGRRALQIDIMDGWAQHRTIVAPSLIPLLGASDPLLTKMRADVRAAGRQPQSVWPWLN